MKMGQYVMHLEGLAQILMDQNLYIVAIVEKQCLIQPCIMNVVGGASQESI